MKYLKTTEMHFINGFDIIFKSEKKFAITKKLTSKNN